MSLAVMNQSRAVSLVHLVSSHLTHVKRVSTTHPRRDLEAYTDEKSGDVLTDVF